MPPEHTNYPAIVVQRVDEHQTPDTTELRSLAEAAGCTVVGELTQERESDAEFEIGSGKLEELCELAEETNATNIIFDGRLTPFQTYNLGIELPDGVDVIDRFLLVLRALEYGAESHREQLQVELGSLRYEIPRIDAKVMLAKRDVQPGFMGLNEYDESHGAVIKDQISDLSSELEHISETNTARRESHKEDGTYMVALAGYTNSGRSALFRQLVEGLPLHRSANADATATVETASTPLTTFEPTTRRMPHDRRDILLTDTLGVISDIPYWLYDSLSPSIEPMYEADALILTVDCTEPTSVMREKIATVQDFLQKETTAPIVTAFTKADSVTDSDIKAKKMALSDIAPNAVITSAITGTGIDELKQVIDGRLPTLVEERLQLPLTDGTMGIVSWIHDNANVTAEDYTNDAVYIGFESNETVVKKARSKAKNLVEVASLDD